MSWNSWLSQLFKSKFNLTKLRQLAAASQANKNKTQIEITNSKILKNLKVKNKLKLNLNH